MARLTDIVRAGTDTVRDPFPAVDNRFDGVPRGRHRGMQGPIPTGGVQAWGTGR